MSSKEGQSNTRCLRLQEANAGVHSGIPIVLHSTISSNQQHVQSSHADMPVGAGLKPCLPIEIPQVDASMLHGEPNQSYGPRGRVIHFMSLTVTALIL